MDNFKEPEWLEKTVVGGLRLWHIMFFCLAGVMAMIVMVCCCFRFRIPRTKQQIEADYQRRKITTKFRQQLETIQDAKMDAMSLKDGDAISRIIAILLRLAQAYRQSKYFTVRVLCTPPLPPPALDLLHEKKMEEEKQASPPSVMSPQLSSLDASTQPETQKPEPQGTAFVKFATKVAHLSKLGGPKSPTSPEPAANRMDF